LNPLLYTLLRWNSNFD